MSIAVVVNPTSGRGQAEGLLGHVLDVVRRTGQDADVTVTRDGDDLRNAVRLARQVQADRVVVIGGDGSLHLAAQELVGGSTALAIIPAGTGDDNARTLGIPLGRPQDAARLAILGAFSTIDLGCVTTGDGTQTFFLGVLSSGFDSLVNERANRMRWPTGKAKYVVALLGELRTFRPVGYRATFDGRVAQGQAMLVAIGNGSSYGGGMQVCLGANPADGLLDVTWLHGVGTGTFLRVFPQVFTGKHITSRYVSTTRATVVHLEADGQIAYADGERIGPLPVNIEVRPQALRVIRGTTDP